MTRALAVVALATLTGLAGDARAADQCRILAVDFTPTDDLQIVVWLEDAAGHYVDTLFITDLTGRRGLGNRPGRLDFNTSWRWPYGRRETTFPVWAHRHGLTFPKIYFQNDDGSHDTENDLSHPVGESSVEEFYCRPRRESEDDWDVQTCASRAYTDKGVASATEDSLYPPRADVAAVDGIDDPSVGEYASLDPFDAVSGATPLGDARHSVLWQVPDGLPVGDYVVWVEAAAELDDNATYDATSYPEPTGILYGDYGVPYRGQPSVVYRVPIAIGPDVAVGATDDYAGYGDPDGQDGAIRPPDATITTTTPGSGAMRLLDTGSGGATYRVHAQSELIVDPVPPGAAQALAPVTVTHAQATITFAEPALGPGVGPVQGYDIRYRAGEPITEANFADSPPIAASVVPIAPGAQQLVTVTDLLPRTRYWIGVRAYDACQELGPLAVVEVQTLEPPVGEVDACFVATAAYGSVLATDVELLRHVRDAYLRSNVLGELLVEAYYTFGPAVAGVIGDSDDLRGVARDVLGPIVDAVRGLD